MHSTNVRILQHPYDDKSKILLTSRHVTYKGLFTQHSDPIFSIKCSVIEIDSFFCQQKFQLIHGLWICVHVWAGMGMCILVCIHVCVCVPNKNYAWSSIHTIFCLTQIQVILKWTIYQGMHCLPSDLMNVLASKSSPVKRCIICWTVSWIKYAKVCTIYSTTWAHLSKHVFILFNDCHLLPPKLFDNTKKNYCKVSFCG